MSNIFNIYMYVNVCINYKEITYNECIHADQKIIFFYGKMYFQMSNDIILCNIVLHSLRLNIGQCSKMARKCQERGVGRWVPTHDMVTTNSFRMSWVVSISITRNRIPKNG